MLQVKEFSAEISIEKLVNDWLAENKDKEIIKIKYSADQYSSNALIIYEEDSESGK
jgi:hypothetical protein